MKGSREMFRKYNVYFLNEYMFFSKINNDRKTYYTIFVCKTIISYV